MNELNFTLPLEVIQLKEEEMALLKGGANEDVYMNNGCDCNCGDCCSASKPTMPPQYRAYLKLLERQNIV